MRKYFHYNESLFEDVFSKLKACAAPKKWQRSRLKDSPESKILSHSPVPTDGNCPTGPMIALHSISFLRFYFQQLTSLSTPILETPVPPLFILPESSQMFMPSLKIIVLPSLFQPSVTYQRRWHQKARGGGAGDAVGKWSHRSEKNIYPLPPTLPA